MQLNIKVGTVLYYSHRFITVSIFCLAAGWAIGVQFVEGTDMIGMSM